MLIHLSLSKLQAMKWIKWEDTTSFLGLNIQKERERVKVQQFKQSEAEASDSSNRKSLPQWVTSEWWDNEGRPGAPDLQFCIFHYATNTTWQLAALISLHLGRCACQCPSCLSSPSTSIPNKFHSAHGPLSVGSPSVHDHWLGPAYWDFP